MEICNSMDNMSQQYYAGMQSDQSEDFASYEQQFDDQSNYDYAQPNGIVCDNNSSSENWLSDGIKCKREIDLADISQPSSSTSNFDTPSNVLECDYNDANCSRVQYEHYDPSMKYMNDANSNLVTSFVKPMPPTHHLQQQRPHHRPYHHVTSVNSHNQIPNWYNAPMHYEAQPSASFHPAYPSHFRDTYLQQNPHHADVNMRNMMSMSNRYLCNVDEQKARIHFRFDVIVDSHSPKADPTQRLRQKKIVYQSKSECHVVVDWLYVCICVHVKSRNDTNFHLKNALPLGGNDPQLKKKMKGQEKKREKLLFSRRHHCSSLLSERRKKRNVENNITCLTLHM